MKTAPPIPPPILYRDSDILVCVKPGHQIVHPNPLWPDGPSLLRILEKSLRQKLYTIHRLDRAASGLIAFGLSSGGARRLQEALSAESAVKEYVTLVRGYPKEQDVIDIPLTDRRTMVLKDALTEYSTIARLDRCSLLRVRIHTGRHRQIRRHFDKIAHQIIGCTHFGKGRINQYFRDHYGLDRVFLHAVRLEIDLPLVAERLICLSRLPTDLRGTLSQIPGSSQELLESL